MMELNGYVDGFRWSDLEGRVRALALTNGCKVSRLDSEKVFPMRKRVSFSVSGELSEVREFRDLILLVAGRSVTLQQDAGFGQSGSYGSIALAK